MQHAQVLFVSWLLIPSSRYVARSLCAIWENPALPEMAVLCRVDIRDTFIDSLGSLRKRYPVKRTEMLARHAFRGVQTVRQKARSKDPLGAGYLARNELIHGTSEATKKA
jgi:hypothetical protein